MKLTKRFAATLLFLCGIPAWSQAIWPEPAQLLKQQRDEFERQLKFAESGNLSAELFIAKSYETGALGWDTTRAFEWFQKAADLGSLEAKSWAASLMMLGHGTTRDEAKAFQILTENAEKGDSTAMVFLGLAHEFGYGTTLDYAAARTFYENALKLANPDAASHLAGLYVRGSGVEKDRKTITQYQMKGAELGERYAEYAVGMMYLQGKDVPKDTFKARQYILDSALKGSAEALYRVGLMLQEGMEFQQNYQTAAVFFHRLAMHHYSPAYVMLGEIYWKGNAAPRDLVRAFVWMSIAASKNNRQAEVLLKQLKAQMTEDEIKRAYDFANDNPAFMRHYQGTMLPQ